MRARPASEAAETPAPETAAMRLDLWLCHARFFRTRSLAQQVVAAGHVRVNGRRTRKAAQPVRPGDVLIFRQADSLRSIRILAPALRRGPAVEAQGLYLDLDAPVSAPGSPLE